MTTYATHHAAVQAAQTLADHLGRPCQVVHLPASREVPIDCWTVVVCGEAPWGWGAFVVVVVVWAVLVTCGLAVVLV